ncbi:hypothetical protein SAMN05421780_11076 [Flexibacter flexilis DSM 6793]|uniref:Uncharacterized protein n=1 Tax=Flexibacter flexilis DSM 6793 TaxID=927664 RepID=A0A1I1MF14_9BACT|nr:hypothetical protein SAMN05421780_11076 [Flexibacter flexilis DSM 6793]
MGILIVVGIIVVVFIGLEYLRPKDDDDYFPPRAGTLP